MLINEMFRLALIVLGFLLACGIGWLALWVRGISNKVTEQDKQIAVLEEQLKGNTDKDAEFRNVIKEGYAELRKEIHMIMEVVKPLSENVAVLMAKVGGK